MCEPPSINLLKFYSPCTGASRGKERDMWSSGVWEWREEAQCVDNASLRSQRLPSQHGEVR